MNTVMAHGSAPHLSLEAQERLGRIREAEAGIGRRLAAREITDEEFWATMDAVRLAYHDWEAGLGAPGDCPPWCNSHSYDASVNDDTADERVASTHVHEVRVGEAMLSIAQGDDGRLEVDLLGASGMSVEQVRSFATGLLAACDAVSAV